MAAANVGGAGAGNGGGAPSSAHYTFPYEGKLFTPSRDAQATATSLRQTKDNDRLQMFPQACGDGPTSDKLRSAKCADIMGSMCVEATVQGYSKAKGGQPMYGSPLLDPQSVCRAWASMVRAYVPVTDTKPTDAYWKHDPSTWADIQKTVRQGGATTLAPLALGYVYDSIVARASLTASPKTTQLTEAKCVQFVHRAKNWCQTQRQQCDSYGTVQPFMQQTCAMKAFTDSDTAVEFDKCAPFYCWYQPCYNPLSEALIPLALSNAQQDCPGVCIQKETSNREKISVLPSEKPINGQVVNKVNQNMIQECGKNNIIPNKLEMLEFQVMIPKNARTEFQFGAGNMGNFTFMIYTIHVYSKSHPHCNLAVRPSQGVLGPKQTSSWSVFIDSDYWQTLQQGATVDIHVQFTYNPGIPPKPNNMSARINDATQRLQTERVIKATVAAPVGNAITTDYGLTKTALVWILVGAAVLWLGLLVYFRASQSKAVADAAKHRRAKAKKHDPKKDLQKELRDTPSLTEGVPSI